MRDGPRLTALIVWTSILLVLSLAAAVTRYEIFRTTFAGFEDDGSDPGRREFYLHLFSFAEVLDRVIPALSLATGVSLVVLLAIAAVRWQRLENHARRDATDQAEATAAS